MSVGRATRCAVGALLSAALLLVAPLSSPVRADGPLTITGTVSSPYAGTFDYIQVIGPDGTDYVDNGNPDGHFTFNGQAGDYTVYVGQYGGTFDTSWNFYGVTDPITIAASGPLNVAVPIHVLQIRTEAPGGALRASSIQYDCSDATPAGWSQTSSNGSANNAGQSSIYTTNTANAAQDCGLRVDPETGPIRRMRVPGNATTYTHVVTPGVHVSGTISDGLGHPAPAGTSVTSFFDADDDTSGYTTTDAAGHYDLELDPGSHWFDTSFVDADRQTMAYRVTTSPQSIVSTTNLALAPVLDTLTVHARDAGNDPVPSTAQLYCSGKPLGQSLVDHQFTLVDKPEGTDFALPGTAAVESPACTLALDPTVGVYDSQGVDVPDGGGNLTVTLDRGITVTGQLTVPELAAPNYGNAQVSISPSGHETDTTFTATDGSFSLSGMAAGPATIDVAVNAPSWGGAVQWQHQQTLSGGENLALAPDLDYLVLYLLDETGNPGEGDAQLSCNGSHAGDTNTYTSTVVTRHVLDFGGIPGYAADGGPCHLVVTWSDATVTTKDITLDPDNATSLTLLKNGVLFDGDPTASNDDDGVADSVEAYAPNQGDGNDDGTPDYEQADVASLPENGAGLGSGEDYLTVAGPDGSTLAAVATDDVVPQRAGHDLDGPPDGTDLPLGYLDFAVEGIPAGSTQQVTVTVPDTTGLNGYAVRDLTTGTWTDMPGADVSFTPTTIVLTVTDGGPLDQDPVAGRIRHPGGGTRVDVGVPVVTGQATTEPNDKGWYAGNVTVHWSVVDDDDTVTPPADTVVSTEGDDVTATAAQVCDRRDNCATPQLKHLKIDKTKPVVNLTGPAQGATYVLGSAPARSCTATDPGGSGVPDGGACVVTVTGNPAAVGTVTVTAKATDRAGNVATKTVSYKQVYPAGGLTPASGGKLKVYKQGSTVVVRISIATAKAPVWVGPKAKGKSTGKVNQPVSKLKPDKGTVLVKRGSFWEYRWGTAKAKKGTAYVITVKLDDGTTRSVTVGIG